MFGLNFGVRKGNYLLWCNIVKIESAGYRSSSATWIWLTSEHLRSALRWSITQRRAAIHYRRFGTTYLSHLRWPINRRKNVLCNNYYSLRIMTLKRAGLVYFRDGNMNSSKYPLHDRRILCLDRNLWFV